MLTLFLIVIIIIDCMVCVCVRVWGDTRISTPTFVKGAMGS